jgi:hypothetical protein
MALDIKLKIETTEDCKNLVISDVTGVYNETSNPGGWGGFNIDGNRSTHNIGLYMVVYHITDGEEYSTPINITNFSSTVDYPTEKFHRGFKISIPSYDISTEVANAPYLTTESYDPIQEVLADSLYEIIVHVNGSNPDYDKEFKFTFRSICNSQKAVEKVMGQINLGCEDCDDSDIDSALLAKSLLESLKNMR